MQRMLSAGTRLGPYEIIAPIGAGDMSEVHRARMPSFTPAQWVSVIGWWEVLIGVTFLFRPTLRIAIGLMFLQMGGTFLPLLLLPNITFQAGHYPFVPTMEGQYIIKNLLIISAALVVGGTVRSSGTNTRN